MVCWMVRILRDSGRDPVAQTARRRGIRKADDPLAVSTLQRHER